MSHSALLWLWAPLALSAALACSDDEEDPNGGGGSGGSAGNAGTGGAGSGGMASGLTCERACAKIVPANCSKGPPGEAICATLCNNILRGENQQCAAAFRTVLECVDESSVFGCATDGNPTAQGCEAEFEALVPCLPQL
jgi:hypothetical protein